MKNNLRMDKYPDEMSVRLRFRVSTLKIFEQIIQGYIDFIIPYRTERNKKITDEIEQWQMILDYTREQMDGQDDYAMVEYGLYGKNYGKLYDLLWKYHNTKRYALEEKKKKVFIAEALEGDEEEVRELNDMLQFPAWEKFTRYKAMIDNFIPKKVPKTDDPVIQQYINVQNMNGILTGINNGQIVQNDNKEVLDALKQLTEILIKENPTDQVTSEALGNIRDIQAEILNPYPDKSRVEKAMDGLQALANLTQLTSFVIQISPHLHTIKQFAENLK